MVDSLPPSGTDPDNETIMTNSNGKLSVPLDGGTLDVGSSGKVKVFDSTEYYLANFAQDSGDWTGIDYVTTSSSGFSYAKVDVDQEVPLPRSASVTADLTGIDVLNFRIKVSDLRLKIKVDGVELVTLDRDNYYYQTVEISGLDNYDFGTNSTLTLEAYYRYPDQSGAFYIDYIRSGITQSESRIVELVDTGGLE